MNFRSDAGLVEGLDFAASAGAVLAIATGLCALTGWTTHVAVLFSWGAGATTVPNTAACFLLLGLSLWLSRGGRHPQSPAKKRIAGAAAGIAGTIALLSLAEYLSRLDLSIDRLLIRQSPQFAGAHTLMSPVTATTFLLLSLALLGIDWRPRRSAWPAQFLCLAAAFAPLFGIFGLIWGPGVSPITLGLPTVVAFVALTAGLLCSRPSWFMNSFLTRQSPGARLLRRALPASLLVLGLIGWLIAKPLLTGTHITWLEFSTIAVIIAASIAGFVGWTAFIIDRSDSERNQREPALNIRQQMDRVLEQVTEPETGLRLQRRAKLAVAIAMLLTTLLGLLSWRMARRAEEEADWIAHTHQTSTSLEAAVRHLLDVETGARGYALTGHEHFLEPYEAGRYAVVLDLQSLRDLITVQDQKLRLELLVQRANTMLAASANLVKARRLADKGDSIADLERAKQVMDAVRAIVQEMETRQKGLLEERLRRARAARLFTSSTIAFGSTFAVLFFFIAGTIISREIGVRARAQTQVKALNADLERRVVERTAALQSEIAARLQTQAQLRASEEVYRLLLDGIKDYAVYMLDPEGRVVSWNSGAASIDGYHAEEIIGQHFSRFSTQADRDGKLPQQSLLEAARAGRVEGQGWRVRKDGSQFWANFIITPVYESNATLRGYSNVVRDITERREAEIALRESEGRLAGVLASAMDSIITVDDQQRVVFFNHAAEQMFLCPASEAMGQRIDRFIPQRFRAAHSGHFSSFDQEGITNRAVGSRNGVWALRADGQEFQSEASISQVVVGGKKLFTVILRDITERKQAEAVRDRLAAVVDWSDDAIISKTLDGTIAAWNRGAEKVFGYSASEMLGKPISMLLPPERIKEEFEILTRIRRGESVEHFETVRLRKDGRKIDVSVTISPIRDGSGAISGASKIARDITGRKRAEEALREKEQLLSEAQRIAHVGSWTYSAFDPGGQLQWSEETYRIYGVSPETFAPAVESLTRLVLPEDRPLMQKWIAACMGGEKPGDFEFRVLLSDGTVRLLNGRGELQLDSALRPIRMIGTVQDITERKQAQDALRESEERFQAMVNGIPQLAWMAEADGSIFWYNQRWYDYTGTTLEQMQGWHWQSVHDPDILPQVIEKWTSAIAAGDPFDMEFPLRGADGLYHAFLTRGMPLKDSAGRVLRWFGTNTDISERKQHEQRLARQAEELVRQAEELMRSQQKIRLLNEQLEERISKRTAQLQTANSELEAFSYSVSHDLRTPLRHIAGFSRILVKDFGPGMAAEAREHLQFIEAAVSRMGSLIDAMLRMATLHRQSLRLRHSELNPIVDEVISLLQPECAGREVKWLIAPLPAVDCDPTLIRQVFQNLLSNALKYSSGRSTSLIEVGSSQLPDKPPVIFVRDNGAGFDMRFAKKLFGIFQRLHTDAEFAGTGVGLATVHRIIQKHGGTIWAEAKVDHGATFFFTLQPPPS